jgi:hypothetical protein
MSKSTLKILPALMVAITASLVTQPTRAGVIDTLVITENSSTSLTATLDNNPLSVTFSFDDGWSIALAGVSAAGGHSSFIQAWSEPGAAGFVNKVIVGAEDNQLLVRSDFPRPSGLADGTPDTTNFALNGGPLSVTFFDKGDVAAAPDTGTTLSLFGLSLTGLAFFRRKLC